MSFEISNALSFFKSEHISIEECRGIETIDLNLEYILVKADVELVAQAFSELKQMDVWVPDAYNREIELQTESTLIFQFRGHPWSLIYKFHNLKEEDALRISESLDTAAIYYTASDTCATIQYHLYRAGVSIEKFSFEEEVSIEVQSEIRQIEANEIEDGYSFAMNFICEQDAYIPALITVRSLPKQTGILRIQGLMPDEIARMDYLAKRLTTANNDIEIRSEVESISNDQAQNEPDYVLDESSEQVPGLVYFSSKNNQTQELRQRSDAEEVFESARKLTGDGQEQESIAAFTSAIELDPNYAEAYFMRGNNRTLIGEPLQGIKDAEKAAEIFNSRGEPEKAKVMLNFADAIRQGIKDGEF
ncbi:MAG: hypothetical protein WA828_20845 [Coleofasciculaceae cyanobacterium]